jgi:GNAT superfamily N-acetyltransferase
MSYAHQEERYLRSLARPGSISVVAVDGRRGPIGFASAGPNRGCEPAYPGELYAIFIRAEHQGRGIGRQLVAAVTHAFLREKVRSMLVWVLAANPFRAFYQRLGAQPLNTRKITLGGVELDEIACAWDDLALLASTCAGPPQ